MRPRTIFVALLLAAVGTAAAIVVISRRGEPTVARFDATAWRESRAGYCLRSRRGEMLSDLLANRIHRGMPMRSVRNLLGAPDEVSRDGTWVYSVDREDGGLLSTCVTLALYPRAGHMDRAVVGRDD